MEPAPEAAPSIAIRLRAGRDRPLVDGHPWLFDGAIAQESGDRAAALARITTADGRDLGLAFYSPSSRIRARLLGSGAARVDRAFFRARIERAFALRERVLPPATTGFRLINAEGDALPGWTVDRFGDVLVSQITVAGLDRLRGDAYGALADLFPDSAILHLGDLAARRREGLANDTAWIRGAERSAARFSEREMELEAELSGGQKTGYYCDQRENRRLVESIAAGRTVLDLFAHSGAFSLFALRGGATTARLVESAGRLLASARLAAAANGIEPQRLDPVEADVFALLRDGDPARYGVVVADPPPLARRRADVERAARAYKDLNRLAMRRLESGGDLFTFSCSGAIDATLFRQIVFAAAAEAGARLQVVAPLAAAPDHPFALAHPEGEYLKGLWLRRLDRPEPR